MKFIQFKVNDELYKKFKKYCIDSDYTMTSKMIELIEKELKSNQSSNLSINQSTDKK